MPIAAITMSHSPLLEFVDPPADVKAQVETAFGAARKFAAEFDPDLVINFAPDHYNGFFYDVMPPFCLGHEATAIGDFGSQAGALDVDTQVARQLTEAILEADIDIAASMRMSIDHGAIQPLEILFGDITAKPVIPIFINAVAPPFAPMRRIRRLGTAVGRFVAEELAGRRVLVLGSGGLSHEPPVPQLATADGQMLDNLLGAGRNLSPEGRQARQDRVITAAQEFAAGSPGTKPLAPEWDKRFMDLMARGDFDTVERWTAEEMTRVAGNSSHEVRTWVASYAAMAAAGDYLTEYTFYRPIPEYIAGFGVTTVAAR
ncbi:3-carboxyethylcatechol 2,3-dioxygenase [Nocardia carnea]|uniref:3-carboxyethylcatechol 2,3-dioxygenase n=1 Tax=Nocardia carnea TaxID=37328 RepID=UPI0024580F5D|nr:3-carboxyethylcatechol 2,3-dioxygenase [Nocardia carnea]